MKLYTQRYLITSDKHDPFFTEWFDPKNNFNSEMGMNVFDLHNHLWTYDGITWHPIESDTL